MKRELTILLCCAGAVLAQGPGGRGPGGPGGPGGFGRGPQMGGRVVTGAPYAGTETFTHQEKLADGNSVNQSSSIARARDGEGRTYSKETITPPASAGKAPYTRITISDPVAGYRYDLNSSTMIAVQSRIPKFVSGGTTTTTTTTPTLPTTTTRPDGATVTVTSLGTSTINGVAATGTQTVEVIPAGTIGNAQAITITRTSWISTTLKLPVQIKSSDPRNGTSDFELTNISTGEPTASLFTVPGGYTIQKGGFGGGRGASGGHGPGPGPNGRGPGGGGREAFGRRAGPAN